MSDTKKLERRLNIILVFVIIETILLAVLILKPDMTDKRIEVAKLEADYSDDDLTLSITFSELSDDNIDIRLVDTNIDDRVIESKLSCDGSLCHVTFDDVNNGAVRAEYDIYIDVISFMAHDHYYLGHLDIYYLDGSYAWMAA